MRLIHLIRYRFLLFAGLLPFLLGQVIAWRAQGFVDIKLSLLSLLGLAFALVGVESFNEYFDARIGTDRVFSLEREDVPKRTFIVGLLSFLSAVAVMIFLAFKLGWPVLAFAVAGGFFAVSYVTPPFKLAYRGLGETAILLSYGPLMTLGSFYVQTRRVDFAPLAASIVPALLILCVTVMNQIPDFYGDRIVGKRNFTVRLGRVKAIRVSAVATITCVVYLIYCSLAGILPPLAWIACIPCLLSLAGIMSVRRRYEEPLVFIKGIRFAIIAYSSAVFLLATSYFYCNYSGILIFCRQTGSVKP